MTPQVVAPAEQTQVIGLLDRIARNLPRFDIRRLIAALGDLCNEAGLDELPKPGAGDGEFLFLSLPPDYLVQSIDVLELPSRVSNALKREDIRTLDDLLERSETEISNIRQFGSYTIELIKTSLAGLGLHLSPHDRGLAAPPGDEWVIVRRPDSEWWVLRSRLGRLSLMWIVVDRVRDDSVLWAFKRQTGGGRIHSLLASSASDLRELSWSTLNVDDPASYALRRIRTMLRKYGLSLRDEAV